MKNFLEDKKNLRIVIGIAVFFLLGAGGLIALELGLFSGSQTASAPPPSAAGAMPGAPTPGGPMSSAPPGSMMGGPPRGMPGAPNPMMGNPGMPRPMTPNAMAPNAMTPNAMGVPGAAPGVKVAAVSTNPAVGPDPFYIPGGQQHLPKPQPFKLPLRNLIGPFNIFQLHARDVVTPIINPITDRGQDQQQQIVHYRLIGVITGGDGVNAILEGDDGQTQSVKAGDTLPDGSKVQNIQATSLTLRTTGGTITTLPLSAGGGDQSTPNPAGQVRFNGPNPMMGQPLNPQGFNP